MTASAISIILDPSEVSTGRTELDINSGSIRIANDGPDWGDAAIAAALADRKFGSVPVGYRIPNRIVTIPLIVRAVTGTTFNQAQTKLQQKVARFQDEGGWLKRVSSNGTTKLYADVVDATLTFPDPRFQDVEGGVVLTLECLPDFYGDEAASGSTYLNLVTNPRAAVDTTGWSTAAGLVNAGATLTRVSAWNDRAFQIATSGAATVQGAYTLFNLTSGESTQARIRLNRTAGTGTIQVVVVRNSAPYTTHTVVSAGTQTGFTEATLNFTPNYTGEWALLVEVNEASATTVQFTDCLVGTPGADYFDGSGRITAAGVWVQDGTTRWSGTAHASSSYLGAGTSVGDHDSLVFHEADIPGDYPARSRYTFTDTGSQARQAVLIASQSRTYDSAATAALAYEAEALTPLDTATVVTQTGAHGGASNNAVKHVHIGPNWTPILSTEHDTLGHLTHTGTYRVFARVWSDNEATMRLEYAVGDAAIRRANSSVTVPSGGAFFIVDLGEVRIPSDADRWIGALFCQSDTSETSTGVDKLWFAPTESIAIAKSRQEVTVDVGVGLSGYTGRDDFLQTAGALNGKTADVGGNWTTVAGDADDFTVNATSDWLERTAVSDASFVGGGRFAVLGSAVTNSGVSVAFGLTTSVPAGFCGVLVRYVDTSNWMAAGLTRDGAGNGYPYVFRVVGGTEVGMYTGASFAVEAAVGYTASLRIAANGAWQFFWRGSWEASGQHSTLATGGTLASGKSGIYDIQTGASANTRNFDQYLAWTPDADPACLSGGTLSARHDGAWRETADADIYAPTHVEGSYPRAPASGLESRTCRTLVLPSAGDFDTLPDSDPLAFTVASAHRPCYLFAPEE